MHTTPPKRGLVSTPAAAHFRATPWPPPFATPRTTATPVSYFSHVNSLYPTFLPIISYSIRSSEADRATLPFPRHRASWFPAPPRATHCLRIVVYGLSPPHTERAEAIEPQRGDPTKESPRRNSKRGFKVPFTSKPHSTLVTQPLIHLDTNSVLLNGLKRFRRPNRPFR